MRHGVKGRKLNKTSQHRKAMMANMSTSLILHEQIKTTVQKAKEIRPYIEKLVTKARINCLSTRRYILSILNNKQATDKLLSTLGPRYKNRPGGYLQIIKSGFRYGDMAHIAYIQFVNRDTSQKGKYNKPA